MATATMSQISSPLVSRGGVASTSSRLRHTPTTCLMFRPRRCNGVPNYASRPAFRPQAGRCNSGWAGGSAFGAGPQVFWGAGANPQSWEQLLRMWGVSADPAKIQEMMRNLERGQSPWDNVNEVVNDVTSAFILPIDVEDADDSYHFIADVPGLEKGDIKIRVNQEERQLTISGERRRAEAADGAAKPRRRSERRFGKFERKFKLPKDADVEAVTARVEKGVLTLMVRKTEAARSNERDVNID